MYLGSKWVLPILLALSISTTVVWITLTTLILRSVEGNWVTTYISAIITSSCASHGSSCPWIDYVRSHTSFWLWMDDLVNLLLVELLLELLTTIQSTGFRSFPLNLWPSFFQLEKRGFMRTDLHSMVEEHLHCDCWKSCSVIQVSTSCCKSFLHFVADVNIEQITKYPSWIYDECSAWQRCICEYMLSPPCLRSCLTAYLILSANIRRRRSRRYIKQSNALDNLDPSNKDDS